MKFKPAAMSSEKSLEIIRNRRTNGRLRGRWSQTAVIDHPPKPRLALTIGVTGHRLHRDPPLAGPGQANARAFDIEAVEQAIGDFFRTTIAAFASVKEGASQSFDPAPPAFTLISSLAEGADRIAARAALAAGFALDVVLPCPSSIYLRTFADDASRGEFDALMASARACLVLPLAGASEKALEDRLPRSYESAGLTMLAQSDILVAVWDGKPADGRGGTGQIVDEAARAGVPVVVVDPSNGATRMLWPDDFSDETFVRHAEDIAPRTVESCVGAVIGRLISPPASPLERTGLAEYLSCRLDHARAKARSGLWTSFVFGGKDIERSRSQWPRVSAAVAAWASNRGAARRYCEALLAAEEIAGRSAGRYRRLFLFSSAASAVAALLVAGAARFHDMHELAAAFEFLTVALVGSLVFFATRRRWHYQWFEAREVVERLRIVSLPWLLGAWPASLKPGQAAWPGWYVRAIAREQPLFSGDLGDLLHEARDILAALVDEQLSYHLGNAERLERRDRVFEGVGLAFLAASLGNNGLYLVAKFAHWASLSEFESWGLAASIFLPAAATASYGVRLFGDFEDLARRSRGAARRLEALKTRLVGELDLAALRALTGQAARAMLSDLEAWRVAVESRRLSAS
ncbi:MAG TPA: hypothetical protein VEF36_10345 [Roseiarcus sp.]|nr:hypothetical protein [Roseiarcus sp.]